MATIIGLIFATLLLGASGKFLHDVYQEAKQAGAFGAAPKGPRGTAQRVKITAQRAPAEARKLAERIPAVPRTKTTRSKGGGSATATPWRERLWGRLVVRRRIPAAVPAGAASSPGGASAPAAPAGPATAAAGNGGATVTDFAAARAARTAQPQNGARPAPAPSADSPADPSGGPAMTTPTTTGTSAAADFFSSLNALTAQARAGGIRSKARVNLVMGEGFGQQAVVLDQHARDLQESGMYPATVWEPVVQAANMLRAAAAKLTESGNAITVIANTPAGELAGRAPHRDELNRV